MRLDNDVQPPRAHETVGAREGEPEFGHDLGDADGGGAGDADAAVDESFGALVAAGFYA